MWFNELRSGDDVPESQAVTHWDQVQLTTVLRRAALALRGREVTQDVMS